MGVSVLMRRGCAVALGAAMVLGSASAALAAPGSAARQGTAMALTANVYCTAADPTSSVDVAVAARLRADLMAAIRNRPASSEGIEIYDDQTQVTCWYRSGSHFYAASVIKAFILAALLRKAQEQGRSLTAAERSYATNMIENSDNTSATILWNDVGPWYRQHFLNLAGMVHTVLKGAWGLSLLTADDEMRLLKLLVYPNAVLTSASRAYELYLMNHVNVFERWGTPYGAPAGVKVYVKNGWLPYPGSLWEINSIGAFIRPATATTPARTYLMAILTYNNPSEGYGITTIQSIAARVHYDWNAGLPKAAASTPPASSTPGATTTSPTPVPDVTSTSAPSPSNS